MLSEAGSAAERLHREQHDRAAGAALALTRLMWDFGSGHRVHWFVHRYDDGTNFYPALVLQGLFRCYDLLYTLPSI